MNAQPFPFASLPAIARKDVRTAARLRASVRALLRPGLFREALGELVGESIAISVRKTTVTEASRMPALGVGIVFTPSDALGMNRGLFVDLEPALAASLVALALKQRVPKIVAGAATTELAGAAAAVVHAALRRAHAGTPLRVAGAAPSTAIARDYAQAHGHVATVWLGVELGGNLYDARVSLPMAELPPPEDVKPQSLSAFGEAALALSLVAATCIAGRDTLASLRPGDVFVIPQFPLRASGDHLLGAVRVAAASGEKAIAGELAEGGRLVLRTDRVEAQSWDLDVAAMAEDSNATLEVLQDAPVVVRVELGAVEMKAREWAALAPGDVVTLGRRLGDPAILRVGGVEVARGELVQVDGEYGVRILHGAR